MEGVGPSHTADNVLDFFPEAKHDGLNVTWAHAVNSREELQHALKGNCMMLETDIIVRGLGTDEPTTIPVNAHPPNADSDITFEEWIDQVIDCPTPKGVKLDFKCPEAVEPTMKIMNKRYSKIHVPLMFNADIADGPNTSRVPLESSRFLKDCSLSNATVTMSLGYTTPEGGCKDTACTYTWEMIFDILRKVQDITQPITFPIRAVGMSTSWQKIVWLLGLNPSYTLTIWSHVRDTVDIQGLLALRKHAGKDRVLYDLPEHLMAEFQKALSTGNVFMPKEAAPLFNSDLWYTDLTDSPSPRSQVFISTTGVAFLSRDSESTTKVHCKQVYDMSETAAKPLSVQGTVHFIDNKSQTDGETQFVMYFSSNADISLPADDSHGQNGTKDLLTIRIGSDGAISCRTLSHDISKQTCVLSSQVYTFQIGNIGIGRSPRLKISAATGNTCEVCLESDTIALPDENLKSDLCVSFAKVGTSKDLLVESLNVSPQQD